MESGLSNKATRKKLIVTSQGYNGKQSSNSTLRGTAQRFNEKQSNDYERLNLESSQNVSQDSRRNKSDVSDYAEKKIMHGRFNRTTHDHLDKP